MIDKKLTQRRRHGEAQAVPLRQHGDLLRAARRPRERQGLPRARLRRQPVPRLLRRHPDHQRRPRERQGERRGARADGAPRPRVDGVPDAAIVELAERLVRASRPAGKLEKAFFCASGTEADETAVALAQAHTGRHGAHRAPPRLLGAQPARAVARGHAKYRIIPTQVAAHQARARAVLLPLPLRPRVPELRREVRAGRRGADPDDDDGPHRRRASSSRSWASAASSRRPTGG